MKRASHIILGVSSITSEKVELLKMNGELEVYVLDHDQASRIKEKDGTIYLSEEGASIFFRNMTDVVYHWYKPDGSKRK